MCRSAAGHTQCTHAACIHFSPTRHTQCMYTLQSYPSHSVHVYTSVLPVTLSACIHFSPTRHTQCMYTLQSYPSHSVHVYTSVLPVTLSACIHFSPTRHTQCMYTLQSYPSHSVHVYTSVLPVTLSAHTSDRTEIAMGQRFYYYPLLFLLLQSYPFFFFSFLSFTLSAHTVHVYTSVLPVTLSACIHFSPTRHTQCTHE